MSKQLPQNQNVPKVKTVFPADAMIGLLRKIDENVREIVSNLRDQGAEVRDEVAALLNTYIELLTKVLEECALFESTIRIWQRKLKRAKDTLTKVLQGRVSVILTDLDEYKPYFDKQGIRYVYQLVQDDFRLEKLELPESGESRIIKDRIAALRRDFEGVEDAIKVVRETEEKRQKSCEEITKKFETFLEKISDTRKALSTLLGDQPNDKQALIESQFVAGLCAAACVLGCVIGAVYWYITGPATSLIVKNAVPLLGLGAGGAGVCTYVVTKQKEEMEKAKKALEDVQTKYLHGMEESTRKQKADWDNIVIQVSKIVHHVNESDMEKIAGNLDPIDDGKVQELLDGVQAVLEYAEELQENVAQFKKDASRVQRNLRDLSVMKTESEDMLAKPGGSPQPLWDLVAFFQKLLESSEFCYSSKSE